MLFAPELSPGLVPMSRLGGPGDGHLSPWQVEAVVSASLVSPLGLLRVSAQKTAAMVSTGGAFRDHLHDLHLLASTPTPPQLSSVQDILVLHLNKPTGHF